MNPNHFLAVAIAYLLSHRPGLGEGHRRRQDAGVQLAHRPGGRRPRPAADRGAGRVQVVRAGPARRVGRLRRGGVRRCLVPPPGRQRLDDGQGRHPAGPAGQRDPGRDGTVPLGAARAADRPLRRVGVRAGRRPGQPGAEGGAGQALPRRRHRHRAGRRADHREADPGAGQRRARSAGSRWSPRTPGSPPGRRAPRTSTRSTPSPSAGPSTSPRCRRRPAAVVTAALGG